MDDADLEKLIIKPGKLKPKFNRNVTQYEVVLNSGSCTELRTNVQQCLGTPRKSGNHVQRRQRVL